MSAPTMPWLRLYTEFIYNRKIIRLPVPLQLMLVKFWCLHRAGHFVGATPADIAFELRDETVDETAVSDAIEALKRAGLIDCNGSIHHWKEHQPQQFTSTDRVRKHRMKRAGNVSGNGHETHRLDKIDKIDRADVPSSGQTVEEWAADFEARTGMRPLLDGDKP